MRISYLELVFIIEENSDQTERVQFVFVVRIINRELCILWLDWTEKIGNQ